MKVILVGVKSNDHRPITKTSLGLARIKAYLDSKDAADSELFLLPIDGIQKFNAEEVVSDILEKKPDLVGFSLMHFHFDFFKDLCAGLKKAGIMTMIGGPEVAGDLTELLEGFPCDIAIPGRAEDIVFDIVEGLNNRKSLTEVKGIVIRSGGKIIETGKRVSCIKMDNLPNPFVMGIIKDDVYTIMTYHGCINRCGFCVWAKGPIDYLSTDRLVEEISFAVDNGYRYISFIDAHLNQSDDHLEKVVRALEQADPKQKLMCTFFLDVVSLNEKQFGLLKRMNVVSISVGLQTSSKEALRNIGRAFDAQKFKSNYLELCSTFPDMLITLDLMVGIPGETLESFREMLEYIKDFKAEISVNHLFILPGSGLYHNRKRFSIEHEDKRPFLVKSTYSYSESDLKEMMKLARRFKRFSIKRTEDDFPQKMRMQVLGKDEVTIAGQKIKGDIRPAIEKIFYQNMNLRELAILDMCGHGQAIMEELRSIRFKKLEVYDMRGYVGLKDMTHLVLEVTNSCNNNCLYCYVRKAGKMMSFREIEGIFNAIEPKKVNLELCGGEPTIHPDFFRIIKLARDYHFKKISVITNGRMLSNDRFTRKLISTSIETVVFSLDTLDSDIYKKMCGVDGLEQAKKGIINSTRYDIERSATIVITKYNLDGLRDVVLFLKDKVHSINLQPVLPCVFDKRDLPDLSPTYDETIDAVKELTEEFPGLKLWCFPICESETHEDLDREGRFIVGKDGVIDMQKSLMNKRKLYPKCADCDLIDRCTNYV